VKGKFSYLSPEAASGIAVDHRADVFAVGIILWELFTGRRLFYGDTDYQTVELVRQARVPSIAALNPEIEPELEAIVRKSLSRDPEERYQSAADMADALSQYLFSRRMKVTSRDIQTLVRDAQMELMRKRAAEPKESLIDALIQDEVAKLTSLVDDAEPGDKPKLAEGSVSLDPKEFVDTSSWISDLGFEGQRPSSQIEEPSPPPRQPTPPRPAAPAPRPPPRPSPPPVQSREELDSLQQMLEPDRTGLHAKASSRGVMIALVIALLLALGVGIGVFAFKDKIFGDDAQRSSR
jgi:serine/threonine protein kinase